MMSPAWYGALDTNGRRGFWSSYAGFSIDAMNVQLYAFVLPILLTAWRLSPSRAGLLVTAALVSSAAGGWLAGMISDRVGRVKVLLVTITWLVASSALCGLSQSYDQFLFARVLQGFGFGAEWAVGAVFLGEIASPATRGRLVGTAQSAWAVGWALAAAVSTTALALLPPEIGWRATFFAGLLPALFVFLARMRLAESSTFLADPARHAWHDIFSAGMRGNTLKGCLLAAGTHGGYWAIASWWPTMLRLERGMSGAEASLHIATLVASSFAGYILAAWLADTVGRRAAIKVFAAGGIITVLAATQLPLSPAALLLIAMPLGICVLGLYSAIGPALIELYPTRMRGSGLGFCYNVGRGIAGAAPLAIGTGINMLGVARSIGLYVCVAYALVLITAVFLQETGGPDCERFTAMPR